MDSRYAQTGNSNDAKKATDTGNDPMTDPRSIRAGVLQLDIKKGKIEPNLQNACNGIRRLSERGADLVVLPEMWSCGFDHSHLKTHAEKTPEILDILSYLSKTAGLMIAGSMPETCEGGLYNTLYLIDRNGRVAGAYRKIHLFGPNKENTYFKAGNQAQVCETSAGPIGLMTCYDLRFPELCRVLALCGARMVIVSAQWPESRIDHWDILLRARAIENHIFIVAANRCGQDDALRFPGRSQIIAPTGKILARLDQAEAEATATLAFADVITSRRPFNCLQERAPSAYAF